MTEKKIPIKISTGKLNNRFSFNWFPWFSFVFFIVLFLAGVFYLYNIWLMPWLSGVTKISAGAAEEIPGVALTDHDGDGLTLNLETKYGTSDNMTDSDLDGLTDLEEIGIGTDPTKTDTDMDGYDDFVEVDSGHNPLR